MKKYSFDVMRKYSPSFKFSIPLHIFIVLPILLHEIYIYSIYWTIIANAKSFENFHLHRITKMNHNYKLDNSDKYKIYECSLFTGSTSDCLALVRDTFVDLR